LKVGGGCGGAKYPGCACAIATLKKATHPTAKNLASAIRSNLVVCIAVPSSRGIGPAPLDGQHHHQCCGSGGVLAQSSWLAEFGGLGMSFNICCGTLGSLAMLAAMRRASSRVSRLVYD
jgi:hypothetical protein